MFQALHFDALKKYNDFKPQISKPFNEELVQLFETHQEVFGEEEGFEETIKVQKLCLEPFGGEDEETLYSSLL